MASWSNPSPLAVEASTQPDEVPWSVVDGLIVLIGAFVIYVAGSIVVASIDYPFEGKHTGFWVIPASYLFLSLGVYVMSTWIVVRRRGGTWKLIGYTLPEDQSMLASIGKLLLLALGAYIAVVVGTAIIVGVFQLTAFHIKSNVKELLPNGQSTINLAQYLTLVVVAAVLAPVTEETLFRGVLYQGMRKSARRYLGVAGGISLAVFVDGLLFGGFHLIGGASEINTLPILAFLGIALAVVFQLGRSLGGSMLVHATVNFISVTALFVAHSAQ